MEQGTPIWVMQDGGEFYIYKKDPTQSEYTDLWNVLICPTKVGYSIELAQEAREWFIKEAETRAWNPTFVS